MTSQTSFGACIKCHAELREWPFCMPCFLIQPFRPWDAFDLFGIERTFIQDKLVLNKKYLQLQKIFHPDRFPTNSIDQKKLAQHYTDYINQSYKALQHPVERAKLLLRREDQFVDLPPVSHDILQDIMAWREQWASAHTPDDQQRCLSDLQSHIAKQEQSMADSFAQGSMKSFLEQAAALDYKIKFLRDIKNILVLHDASSN